MTERDNPLDRLTRPGGRPISDDETIPVLTERLMLPSLDLDISLPKAVPPPPAPVPAPRPVAAPPPPPPPPPPPAPPPPPPAPVPAPVVAAPAVIAPPPAVVAPPPVVVAPVVSAPPVAALPPVAAAPVIPLPVPTPPPVPEIDWTRIEHTLRDAVLRDLQPLLADEALRVVRERLQPAIERVLLAANAELRTSFEQKLRETVARAVAAEVARLRSR